MIGMVVAVKNYTMGTMDKCFNLIFLIFLKIKDVKNEKDFTVFMCGVNGFWDVGECECDTCYF